MIEETKLCPYCREVIKAGAIRCKHCQATLDEASSPVTPMPTGGTDGDVIPAWAAGTGAIPTGTEIGNYRVIRLLGAGGMGEVYLAEHTYTGQKVALKAVHTGLMSDQSVRRRFLEEGRVMADLRHPGIVTLYNFFEEQGRFFLVLEYVEGMTLGERLKGGPLAAGEASRICCEVLSALQYAHTRPDPVIHRDIKPANIMLAEDGRVVVMDFGIAKALGREKLTKTGGAIGTYEYMSPEQVQGGALAVTSDLYSVGIVLYQMLTGVVPFPQETDSGFEVMRAHVDIPPPPLSFRCPDVPLGLQAVLDRALVKDPGKRHPDAASLSRAVDVASQSKAAHAPLPDEGGVAPKASGLRWVFAVIILALVGVGIAAGAGVFEDESATASVKQGKKDETAKAAKPPKTELPAAEEREAEKKAKPAAEPLAEPVAEPTIEAAAQPAEELEVELVADRVIEKEAEPVVETEAVEAPAAPEPVAQADPESDESGRLSPEARRKRIQEIYRLGRSDDPGDVKKLAEVINDGGTPGYVRATAIRALGSGRRAELVPSLKTLADDKDLALSSEAAILLFQWGEKDLARPKLQKLQESGIALRRAFFIGLKDGNYLYAPEAEEFFRAGLDAPEAHVRLDAALGLLHLGKTDVAMRPFEDALAAGEKSYVRLTAVSYLASARESPRARTLLKKAAKDSDPKVAARASQILGTGH